MLSIFKKYLILLGIFTVLLVAFFFIYPIWGFQDLAHFTIQPLFTVEINLNQFSFSGWQSKNWFSENWPNEFLDQCRHSDSDFSLLGLNFTPELISLLDQVALAGFNGQDDEISLVLILKTKVLVSSPSLILAGPNGRQFYVKEIRPRVLALASDETWLENIFLEDSDNLGDSNNLSDSSNGVIGQLFMSNWHKINWWGKGSLNPSSLEKYLEKKSSDQWRAVLKGLSQEAFSEEIKLIFKNHASNLIFSSSNFDLDAPPYLNESFSLKQGQQFVFPSTDWLIWNFNPQIFSQQMGLKGIYPNLLVPVWQNGDNLDKIFLGSIFVFSAQETLDQVEDRIKFSLAEQNPHRRQVVLPDQTSFNELIVEPKIFKFNRQEINNTELRWLKQSNFEVAIAIDQDYFLVTDKLTALNYYLENKDTRDLDSILSQRSCLSEQWQNQFYQAGYFKDKNYFQDMAIVLSKKQLWGCLSLPK